jgi:hypothetical protein
VSARELLWERVNAALDAGADPFDDAGVQSALEEAPELLVELSRLRERLDGVSRNRALDRGRLWEHLDDAFDARRDPLDDPEVQRALERDPSGLEELVRFDARLRAIAAAERAAERRPKWSMQRRRRAAAAAAVLALAAAATWIVGGRNFGGNETPEVRLAAAPDSRVLSFTSEVVVERPDGRTVIVFDGAKTYRSSDSYATTRTPADAVRFVAVVELFSVQR